MRLATTFLQYILTIPMRLATTFTVLNNSYDISLGRSRSHQKKHGERSKH